jgi:hypothetical protein
VARAADDRIEYGVKYGPNHVRIYADLDAARRMAKHPLDHVVMRRVSGWEEVPDDE